MNAYAIFQAEAALDLAFARTNELAHAADVDRLIASRSRRPGLFARAIAAFRRAVTTPADAPAAGLPGLTEYPYRS